MWTLARSLEVSDAHRAEKTQARLLTVKEVESLETCLSKEQISLVDRVACGCMLFCLYSRSRWSDLKKVYVFQADVTESQRKKSGYLECPTRSHKTARLAGKSGLAMPLVAPVWGVSLLWEGPSWNWHGSYADCLQARWKLVREVGHNIRGEKMVQENAAQFRLSLRVHHSAHLERNTSFLVYQGGPWPVRRAAPWSSSDREVIRRVLWPWQSCEAVERDWQCSSRFAPVPSAPDPSLGYAHASGAQDSDTPTAVEASDSSSESDSPRQSSDSENEPPDAHDPVAAPRQWDP